VKKVIIAGKKSKEVDEYIASFPFEVQRILQGLREAIREAAPEADEAISYKMPALKQNGVLVWFAAFKDHVSFFPKVSAIVAFQDRLVPYRTSKGTIQFPLDKPIPLDLVKDIVRFRVKENMSKP
jgi:uncharacterized protein YdhG (YjbR/CyaY superfamily)